MRDEDLLDHDAIPPFSLTWQGKEYDLVPDLRVKTLKRYEKLTGRNFLVDVRKMFGAEADDAASSLVGGYFAAVFPTFETQMLFVYLTVEKQLPKHDLGREATIDAFLEGLSPKGLADAINGAILATVNFFRAAGVFSSKARQEPTGKDAGEDGGQGPTFTASPE